MITHLFLIMLFIVKITYFIIKFLIVSIYSFFFTVYYLYKFKNIELKLIHIYIHNKYHYLYLSKLLLLNCVMRSS